MHASARARSSAPVQLELHLESFDGPLELLLLLIEQRRLPITQVSLAQVADQYLAQVHAQPALDTDLLADFLVIGGKLLLLKSRALLLTEEPDPEVEEVASDLAERLATYRVFRAAAELLRELEQRGERTYPTLREPLISTRCWRCGVDSKPAQRPARSTFRVSAGRASTNGAATSSTRCARRRAFRFAHSPGRRSTRWSRRSWRCSSCFAAARSASNNQHLLATSS